MFIIDNTSIASVSIALGQCQTKINSLQINYPNENCNKKALLLQDPHIYKGFRLDCLSNLENVH